MSGHIWYTSITQTETIMYFLTGLWYTSAMKKIIIQLVSTTNTAARIIGFDFISECFT